MPLFELTNDQLAGLPVTTFEDEGILERPKLQRLLKDNISIVSSDTLLIAEEFSEWEDSNRRIDLLGINSEGNLVVIEIKRTETGGNMELQALRYAAMVSTLTFSRAIDHYRGVPQWKRFNRRCREIAA